MTRRITPREIRAENPSPMTLDGTRTYIVGRDRPAVIDPGPDDDRHHTAIKAALGDAVPVAILLTHEHPDHAAGAARLARSTGAPVRGARGTAHPRFEEGLVEWLDDGDEVPTDGGVLRVVATPGHVPEHLAYLWAGGGAPDGGAVFVGDLMMGQGDTALVAAPEGDLRAYLRSLDRVEALNASVIYPAHGPPITDPAGAIERYRAHRRARLEQLRAALRQNPDAGAGRLVDVIYGPDLHPELRSAAAGSISAMLRYLEEG